MKFFKRLRRSARAAKAPLYTDLGTTVAQAASTTAIAAGIGGGAPLAKERKGKKPEDVED
ncbi:hypothetical protein [Catenulispora pinisilvae]|uniref:hypothetical protein n=1 Tax=Catenulispora pinisilvae TaxID=2705253 RepID=UPI0018922C29|nr:hypothetical protein [Catenulispora pinisilvae]